MYSCASQTHLIMKGFSIQVPSYHPAFDGLNRHAPTFLPSFHRRNQGGLKEPEIWSAVAKEPPIFRTKGMMGSENGNKTTLPETNMAPENGWLEY